jgi:hypothetical protein
MREFLKRRPWIWVIALIALVFGFEGIFFYVASATAGPELEPMQPTATAAPTPHD